MFSIELEEKQWPEQLQDRFTGVKKGISNVFAGCKSAKDIMIKFSEMSVKEIYDLWEYLPELTYKLTRKPVLKALFEQEIGVFIDYLSIDDDSKKDDFLSKKLSDYDETINSIKDRLNNYSQILSKKLGISNKKLYKDLKNLNVKYDELMMENNILTQEISDMKRKDREKPIPEVVQIMTPNILTEEENKNLKKKIKKKKKQLEDYVSQISDWREETWKLKNELEKLTIKYNKVMSEYEPISEGGFLIYKLNDKLNSIKISNKLIKTIKKRMEKHDIETSLMEFLSGNTSVSEINNKYQTAMVEIEKKERIIMELENEANRVKNIYYVKRDDCDLKRTEYLLRIRNHETIEDDMANVLKDWANLKKEKDDVVAELKNVMEQLNDYKSNWDKIINRRIKKALKKHELFQTDMKKQLDFYYYVKNKKNKNEKIKKKVYHECDICKKNETLKYLPFILNNYTRGKLNERGLACCLKLDPKKSCKEMEKIHLKAIRLLSRLFNNKAVIWYRNFLRKKYYFENDNHGMGRNKDERFYKTYIDPFNEKNNLEDFLGMNANEKTVKFFRKYKQLDEEVGSKTTLYNMSKKDYSVAHGVDIKKTKILATNWNISIFQNKQGDNDKIREEIRINKVNEIEQKIKKEMSKFINMKDALANKLLSFVNKEDNMKDQREKINELFNLYVIKNLDRAVEHDMEVYRKKMINIAHEDEKDFKTMEIIKNITTNPDTINMLWKTYLDDKEAEKRKEFKKQRRTTFNYDDYDSDYCLDDDDVMYM